jgi:hypothetical protein
LVAGRQLSVVQEATVPCHLNAGERLIDRQEHGDYFFHVSSCCRSRLPFGKTKKAHSSQA